MLQIIAALRFFSAYCKWVIFAKEFSIWFHRYSKFVLCCFVLLSLLHHILCKFLHQIHSWVMALFIVLLWNYVLMQGWMLCVLFWPFVWMAPWRPMSNGMTGEPLTLSWNSLSRVLWYNLTAINAACELKPQQHTYRTRCVFDFKAAISLLSLFIP